MPAETDPDASEIVVPVDIVSAASVNAIDIMSHASGVNEAIGVELTSRFDVTHDGADRFVFKVPSLRNVALTAPYFHDGSAKTLDDAVVVMFKYQLGRVATKEDRMAIVSFLNTLTGDQSGLQP